MTWVDDLRARPLRGVAEALGMTWADRTHFGPCPACRGETRSRTDARKGPLYTVGAAGWKCGTCDARGDVVALVEHVVAGGRLRSGDPRWTEVRRWVEGTGVTWSVAEPAPRQDHRVRPPKDEVEELWACSTPVTDCERTAAWLTRRLKHHRDVPERAANADMLRVLPTSGLPAWASFAGRPWPAWGYRLVIPLWTADGRMESVRVRCVDPIQRMRDGRDQPKAVTPRGGDVQYEVRGLVMASPIALHLLRGRRPLPIRCVIAEGEPQWLAWWLAGQPSFGVMSGGWTPDHAAKIPGRSAVTVCTDHDDAGDRYAAKIRSTLEHCAVTRWRPDVT